MNTDLSSRERVRLALDHRQTDRVPLSMLCAGINKPVREKLDALLRKERGISIDDYLKPIIDVVHINPSWLRPPLRTIAQIVLINQPA